MRVGTGVIIVDMDECGWRRRGRVTGRGGSRRFSERNAAPRSRGLPARPDGPASIGSFFTVGGVGTPLYVAKPGAVSDVG